MIQSNRSAFSDAALIDLQNLWSEVAGQLTRNRSHAAPHEIVEIKTPSTRSDQSYRQNKTSLSVTATERYTPRGKLPAPRQRLSQRVLRIL